MFDSGKKGSIEKEKVRTILNTLGQTYDDKELEDLLKGEDPEGRKGVQYAYLILRCFDLVVAACVLLYFWNGSRANDLYLSICQRSFCF